MNEHRDRIIDKVKDDMKTTRKSIAVGTSPINGEIFAGTLMKDGVSWSENKTEVTMQALYAVAEHISRFKEDSSVILTHGGKQKFKLTVESLQ